MTAVATAPPAASTLAHPESVGPIGRLGRWTADHVRVVAIAWRLEWIGGIGFISLAVLYAVRVHGRVDWVAVISGPLVIVGVLFLVSWRYHAAVRSVE